MDGKSVYQEDIKNIYKDMEELKIEVAVMQERIQGNYLKLCEKIDDLSGVYKKHCEESRLNAEKQEEKKDTRVWSIQKFIITTILGIMILAGWELVKNNIIGGRNDRNSQTSSSTGTSNIRVRPTNIKRTNAITRRY